VADQVARAEPLRVPALRGGLFDLPNFRKREWHPAIEASGVPMPARTYDLLSTFASNALAAGISVLELARVMGTSATMIERHYGTLTEGAGADIAWRLNAFDARHDLRHPGAPSHQNRRTSAGNVECPREDSNLRPAA
jgi:hypothetical protein